MLSLAQAAEKRGAAGQPLPPVFSSLEACEVRFYRGQLSLVIGPASSGKSLLTQNLLVKMGVPALALLLDQDRLSAVARFASVVTGDRFLDIKERIDDYGDVLRGLDIQAEFRVEDMDDIKLQMSAYEERYGAPPEVLLVDNLGNMTSGYQDEWAMLKALTLELDKLAQDEQCAVIACHHTTDLMGCDPAARDKMLGKISHYPRLILSIGFNETTGEYKVAYVKNSSGPTDKEAKHPVTMWADPARMAITETAPHPQLQQAQQQRYQPVQPYYAQPDRPAFGGFRG